MLTDTILNSLVAYLNGDTEHYLDEGLDITSAILDDNQVVITFESLDGGTVPFRASFHLGALELATSARLSRNPGP